jgi:hypothetical protein
MAEGKRPTFSVSVVGESPNRAVLAKESIAAGSRLFFEHAPPAGYCLDIEQWRHYCAYCLCDSDTSQLKQCSACKQVMYCDVECQRKHRPIHNTEECTLISNVFKSGSKLPECLRDVIMIRRALFNAELKECLELMADVPLPFNKELADLSRSLGKIRILGLKDIKPALVFSVLRKFQANSFALQNSYAIPIGHGVFPFTSLLNHSCEPNLALVTDLEAGHVPIQTFIALRHIDKGEELTHCYVNQLEPTCLRFESLIKRYGFECKCRRCLHPTLIDLNFIQFPPAMLNFTKLDSDITLSELTAEVKRTESILQGLPHYAMRYRYFQLFSMSMVQKQFKTAASLLNKIIAHDRLVLSEHHPTLLIHYNFRSFIQSQLENESGKK